MGDLLIEIGTEELPSSVIVPALDFFKGKFSEILGREDIDTYGTPRRLVFHIKDFTDTKEVKEELVFGPPWAVAFDGEGKPTKALEGFLNRYGVGPERIVKERKGKGEYAALRIIHEEKSRLERLKEEFEELLLSVPFPKRMRWTSSKKITFSRPVRWILALHGDRVVELRFGELSSGNKTKGHRFLSKGWIEVRKAEDYFHLMEDNFVIPSLDRRKELILKGIKEEAKKLGAEPKYPDGLLDEVANLVEYPFVVTGGFEEKYLELPEMVIITVAAHHQRFFCLSREGKLINRFIGISNNTPKTDLIKKGYEKVLRARLEDALFFYREDLRTPLEELVPALKNVLIHPKIGTVLEKVERLKRISKELCRKLGCDKATERRVERAALLSKADLLTEMVKELDELQGYMGYVYALKHGEDEEVAKALYEQYKPKGVEDTVPQTLTGAILSLSDKIDDLISFFSAGEIPKGSSDPFGLRRAAFGVFRILEDKGWDIDLREFFPLYPEVKNTEELERFLAQRLESYLERYGYDIIRAVLKAESPFKPYSVMKKVKELSRVRNTEAFVDIYEGYRRVVKILPKEWENFEVNEELLKEAQEINLWREVRELEGRDFTLEELAGLRKPIDELFDNVLIMDKDENIRNNRLSLLNRVKRLFNRYADLSEVVLQEV
ncbi:glycyl-tRNA synthetase beta chain [Hydrogenivirga caldilitoris]|uniref:Glycine--tRNA ligase beta subunit n=1 Tax=Hydrogenivirga caldilitoris TaxID=246264 RepID=A0A497XRW0_9AQUI|nr:glycine--tRNA ligase subunit beta [Hydrogenivirga caldilitoris]RLJ71014.1 glycyl-tRNA synthetase beta chain [Hydrogenivirga caldilitoris]